MKSRPSPRGPRPAAALQLPILSIACAALLAGCEGGFRDSLPPISSGGAGGDAPPVPVFARFAVVSNAGDATVSVYTLSDAERLRHATYAHVADEIAEPEAIAAAPRGEAVYLSDALSTNLAVLAVDPLTGTLTPDGTATLGAAPHSLALHPDGGFLFALSAGSDELSVFAVDPDTAQLDPLGAPLTVETGATELLLAADGGLLVTLHRDSGRVATYLFDAADGGLTAADAIVIHPATPSGGALGAAGDALYVCDDGGDLVVQCGLDPLTGGLSLVASYATDVGPAAAAVHPAGGFLFVACPGSATTARYAVDAATGDLSPLASLVGSAGDAALSFSPGGDTLLVVDGAAHGLRTGAVDAEDGSLSSTATLRARLDPRAVAIVHSPAPQPRTTHLFVTNSEGDDVSTFSLQTDPGLPVEVGTALTGASPQAVAVDPLDRFVFVANADTGGVGVYTLGTDGLLIDNGTSAEPGAAAAAVAVEPTGRFVYAAFSDTSTVGAFGLAEDGTLTAVDSEPIGGGPMKVAVDPTGRFLYVVDGGGGGAGSNGAIAVFAIDPAAGGLTPLTPDAVAQGMPTSLAFSPGGARAYTTLATAEEVVPYDVNALDGALAVVPPGTAVDSFPVDVAISPSGRYAYVAAFFTSGSGAGEIQLFDVRPETGDLVNLDDGGSFTPRFAVEAGAGTQALLIDSAEEHLYALNLNSATMSVFAIGEEGLLELLADVPCGLAPRGLAARVALE
ncbi:MAG: beta-propeller fold lactonase family protein [Planctomycetota bacterium]|jgi:6-phosphogluconolactonase (cycloisomerase 2 family)|nr:beta-propeller fold lactonase family protein [Planctomycetota bacterium]MDP6763995.1 beta-propeller fold lactonase family protein [Planctomycetota bacterium]MDP6988342.1 beta-propeller fold lactonase family protein [Planctomycetota bacterium]